MNKIIATVAIAVSAFVATPSQASAHHTDRFQIRCPEYVLLNRYIASEFNISVFDVDYMMWRESRCLKGVHNDLDPNGGSYGLFQINRFWCQPNKYTERGFLQDNGVLKFCYELFDPYTNARAFMAIFAYGVERHGTGWGPWGGEPQWT